MTVPSVTLLHVEDDALWRACIAEALRNMPEVRLYEAVATAAAALDRVAKLHPTLLLLDVVLADGDGLTLARQLVTQEPRLRVILISARRDDAVLQASGEPHIAGILRKTGSFLTELPEAIRTVIRGEKYLPTEVREALRDFRTDPEAWFKVLTDRELQLLPYFGEGASDDEVATAFHLTVGTVRSHRLSILTKLNLPNKARLIHWAIKRGFVRFPSDGWIAR